MAEYPPDVSVLSASGPAALGEDSDCRRELEGRTGVASRADPDPGAWTADDVRPAVYMSVQDPTDEVILLTSSTGAVCSS